MEQAASSYKRLRQQHGENILMTNYVVQMVYIQSCDCALVL